MCALGLGSTCHCHQQQCCCSPGGICSSKAASRWPTSENLVRELGDCWPCGISQLGRHQELMLKKDVVSRGLGSVGLQFSLAHCGLNVLLQLTLRHWAKYLCPAQRAWAIPLFCFNLSRRALHLIADQWIWLLPVSSLPGIHRNSECACSLPRGTTCLHHWCLYIWIYSCIFSRWFSYNLLAGTWSFPVQPILQKLSHVAGVLSSWILALLDSSRSEVTRLCLCYVIMPLGCFKAKLLSGKRSPSQACSYGPSLPGNRSLWWKGVGTRFLLRDGIMRKQGSHCILDIC